MEFGLKWCHRNKYFAALAAYRGGKTVMPWRNYVTVARRIAKDGHLRRRRLTGEDSLEMEGESRAGRQRNYSSVGECSFIAVMATMRFDVTIVCVWRPHERRRMPHGLWRDRPGTSGTVCPRLSVHSSRACLTIDRSPLNQQRLGWPVYVKPPT